MDNLNLLQKELEQLKNPEKAKLLQGFFKTGKGEYGEGDVFLGIVVPIQRELVKKYWSLLSLKDIQKMLNSKIHEYRLVGLLILVKKFEKNKEQQKEIYEFYLENARLGNINNWDLVDLSAPRIVGNYLFNNPKEKPILYELAKSSNLWEKRIAVLACFWFIKEKDFKDAIKISERLLQDKHDLIHKAVGWMLREIGKKDEQVLVGFLDKYCKQMPRTMLRYSIEKFKEEKRKYYLNCK